MNQLTSQQIANWKAAIPALEGFTDAEIQALADAAQTKIDAEQPCDVLIDNVRCGVLRKHHSGIDHGFMSPA